MKFSRRTFLKTAGTILGSFLVGARARPVHSSGPGRLLSGREVPGRCPLCSLGCGLIYRSRGPDRWFVEGDPDCPVARGSLCSRGAGLVETWDLESRQKPLYRAPGADDFRVMEWEEAIDLVARRVKDMRNRDLALYQAGGDRISNRFDSLGVIAGGNLTNEEGYLTSKFFRSLGVVDMDTTVRASHGMAVSGLLHTLGLPGGTLPVNQISYSDVVVLVGCNPGQTAPAVCRFLDDVRRRRGTVVILDPRRSETIKKEDLWLQLRPGTDNAVLGAFINWVLQHSDVREDYLVSQSDAAFIVLSEIMGTYERHSSGKNRGRNIVDTSLSEPYSIFQRMKKHFERYDLMKISGIAGVDRDLLRRACTLLARTSSPHFSATFVFGSGALASPSGADAVRMAGAIQALLGNLDKKGGGIILPAAAGNAQGVCDMGLMAPYLPGYLELPPHGTSPLSKEKRDPFEAMLRAWYPSLSAGQAAEYLPEIGPDENPTLSTIIQGIGDERIRALFAIASDPLGSFPDNMSLLKVLDRLDLLVVMDSTTSRISRFWKDFGAREETVKTEVLFIPTEPPALKNGTMTDPGRRVRTVRPVDISKWGVPGLLDFTVSLGNSVRAKYEAEGGVLAGPVLDLSWPLVQTPEGVAAEINGWRQEGSGETALPPGRTWQKGDRCGNHLYRGWAGDGFRAAERRDPVDPDGVGLYDNWGWFWPWGVADPLSWISEPGREKGAYLRWKGQRSDQPSERETLPMRPQLPIKFWKLVEKGSPLPEHYEPFHSPLPDYLTGGRSNPNMQLRRERGEAWGYLSRRPEEVLPQYPVIVSIHRTGNVMGTGGITVLPGTARELGTGRIVEMGGVLAGSLGVHTGDEVVLYSPNSSEGVRAKALVTGRIGFFERDRVLNHVVSVTLYGDSGPGINGLTPPAFDYLTGGLEVRVFMGRIEKA